MNPDPRITLIEAYLRETLDPIEDLIARDALKPIRAILEHAAAGPDA